MWRGELAGTLGQENGEVIDIFLPKFFCPLPFV